MNNLHDSYNDGNTIVQQAAQEKSAKNLNFLIDLAIIAIVAKDTKSMKDEPQTFNKAWSHANLEQNRKWQENSQKEFSDKNTCRCEGKNLKDLCLQIISV